MIPEDMLRKSELALFVHGEILSIMRDDFARFVLHNNFRPNVSGEGTYIDAKIWNEKAVDFESPLFDVWAHKLVDSLNGMENFSMDGKWRQNG